MIVDQDEQKYEYMIEHRLLESYLRYDNEHQSWTDLYSEWDAVPIRRKEDIKQVLDVYRNYLLSANEIDFMKEYLVYRLPIWKRDVQRTLRDNPDFFQGETNPLFTISLADRTFVIDYIMSLGERNRSFLEKEVSLASIIEYQKNISKRTTIMLRTQERIVSIVRDLQTILSADHQIETCMSFRQLTEEIPYTVNPQHDLWYFFNQVRLHESVPFCMYQNFYKFIEHAPLQNEWITHDNKYITAYVSFDQVFQPIHITPHHIQVSSNFTSRDATPETLLRLIDRTFPFDAPLQSQSDNQKQIKSTYHIVYHDIHFHVFLQFIYSHPLYNKCLFIDESRSVLGEKKYIYMYYYPNPRYPKQVVTFTIKHVSDSTIDCGATEASNYSYLQLNISRCPNQALMKQTVHFFCMALESYQESVLEHQLQRERVTIPVKQRTIEKRGKKEGQARGKPYTPLELSPDEIIGRTNEFYLVNPESQPRPFLWNPNEPQDETGQDKPQALLYPKGENRRFYVCNKDPLYKYIDLTVRENEKIPYCFKTNKSQPPSGSDWYKYEHEVVEVKSTKKVSYEKVSSQPIAIGQFGDVLPWMIRWNNIVQPDWEWKRLGITSSSLDSILYVLESVYSDTKPTVASIRILRASMLEKMRQHYGCMMSELQTDRVEPYLEQFEKGYIDPLRYHSFLCQWYKTMIYLIKKDGQKQSFPFYIGHPHYSNEYCVLPTSYERAIYICNNLGTEFLHSSHPICELMVQRNGQQLVKSVPIPSALVDATEHVLVELYGKYVRAEPIRAMTQTISERGWVNWIHLQPNAFSIALFEPLHSLDVPIQNDIFLWKQDEIETFLREHQWTTLGEYTHFNYSGIRARYERYTYFFPIKQSVDNRLQLYHSYERQSRYLLEYSCYLFSGYMKQHQVYRDDIYYHLTQFAEESFVIQPNEYATVVVNRSFDTENELFQNKKVMVPSEKIKRKLIYGVLHEFHTRYGQLQSYERSFVMRNYYMYPNDFHVYPHHHIIKSESAIRLYLSQHDDSISRGVSTIHIHATKPYVLYKPIMGIQRFIMQPVSSLSEAYAISMYWKRFRIHSFPSTFPIIPSDTKWTWVTWINEHDIEIDQHEHAPIVSIVRLHPDQPDQAYVQVMLPL